MKMQKTVAALAATAALTALATGATQASNALASLSSVNGPTVDFTFTGGAGGTLESNAAGVPYTVNDANGMQYGTTALPVYFTFGPISEVGPANFVPDSSGGYTSVTANFTGGAFSISSTSALTGDLLEGTFKGAQLSTVSGDSATVGSMGVNGVVYQSGTLLNTFRAKYGGTGGVGSFGLGLSGINPNLLTQGPDGTGGLPTFNAQGSGGSFSATAVPEPGSVSLFALGGLGLMGLTVRARRRSHTAR